MEGRIVITLRASGGPGRGFLDRARILEARATARGGCLVAFDATRLAFSFEADSLYDALGLVTTPGEDTLGDESPWAVGVAQGDLRSFDDDRSHDGLAWGPSLVDATVLAQAARPGEILCARSVDALRSGELLGRGRAIARDGFLRVRGVRLDPAHPWRRQAIERLSQMRVAPLVVASSSAPQIVEGTLVVLRADPGTGGTRWLTERASGTERALLVSPSGSGLEPLGALRRAFSRSITRELSPLLLELAQPLEALLAGEGLGLEVASRLVSAFLWRGPPRQGPGLLLLDDAKELDPASLEACVRAACAPGASFAIIARLDATSALPTALASLPKAAEIELARLGTEDAEALASGCTSEALDPVARRRWARLGANVPLGIVEAVAWGIAGGDLAWSNGRASPRSRVAGRGKVRAASDWIALRARDETEACRTLLGAVALLGGEARISRLVRVLEVAEQRIDVEAVVEELMRSRWLVDTQEDWVALPSRTHRDALAGLVDASLRTAIHGAAADVIEAGEGAFGHVEAAWHAARAGLGSRASRILLSASRATAEARLEVSTAQLIAFARRTDPACEGAALELLGQALSRNPAFPAPPSRPSAPSSVRRPSSPASVRLAALGPPPATEVAVRARQDSEPPTLAMIGFSAGAAAAAAAAVKAASALEPSPPPGSVAGAVDTSLAARLGELAKDALLNADNAALDRWVDDLRASGESPIFTDRMRALARLARGDISDALRVLRRTRAKLASTEHNLRCQTSLALGVALEVAGRPQEALLEGMDALARARQVGDEHAAKACIAFLAKLYTSVGREEALRLRAGSGSLGG